MTGMRGGLGFAPLTTLSANRDDKSSSFRTSLAKAHAMIFEPSVRLPAPKVIMQSGFRGLASLTMERISDHGVCGLMPIRVPTTFAPRISSSRFNASVLAERDFEAMI